MSKITKTICDACGKELEYTDWYYKARITSESNASSIGEQIADGDYCNECFIDKVLNRCTNKNVNYRGMDKIAEEICRKE